MNPMAKNCFVMMLRKCELYFLDIAVKNCVSRFLVVAYVCAGSCLLQDQMM